jgi:hypothetical protein
MRALAVRPYSFTLIGIRVAKKQNTFEKRRREIDKKQKAEEKRKRRQTKKREDALAASPTNSMDRPTSANPE